MNEAIDFTQKICNICEEIMIRAGPFLKETIYQDLLIHELNLQNINTSREMVFNYKFKDSQNKDVVICNNQFLRSDIELDEHKGIIELKSSTAATKEDHIWQLRNYLEQRQDRNWGIVVNFIHKFGVRTSPKIQCDLLFKGDTHFEVIVGNKKNKVCQYHSWKIESKHYPLKHNVIMDPLSIKSFDTT
jgi:GxxExxY protein